MPGDFIDLDGVEFKVIRRHDSGKGVTLLDLETEEKVNIALGDQSLKKFGFE